MADAEHLAILKKGTPTWNEWRRQNRQVRPDLTDANLADADLTGALLTGAELSAADLTRAKMIGANLTRANLTEARLTRAILMEAVFGGARLCRAVLTEAELAETFLIEADLTLADLTRVNLTGADLTGANLAKANFTGARFAGTVLFATIFGGTNLSETVGLDSCRHLGPSTIDHQTLFRSGRLPLAFLRGCGLPDSLIDYLPPLLSEPIQFYACFISFSSADQRFAERLHTDLQSKDVRCWYAPEDMKIGDKIRERIDETIQFYDKLLLVLSEHSIASQWVEQEVESALAKEREKNRTVLFPVRLDDAVMGIPGGWPAYVRNTRHIGDFREWEIHEKYQNAFNRLVRDLKAEGASGK